jgi:prefoldin subunit 5
MEAPVAGKVSQVNIQMKQIDVALGNLKSTIASLSARLSRVTRIIPDPKAGIEKEPEVLVPLAQELKSFANAIQCASNDINVILINLEL